MDENKRREEIEKEIKKSLLIANIAFKIYSEEELNTHTGVIMKNVNVTIDKERKEAVREYRENILKEIKEIKWYLSSECDILNEVESIINRT